MTTQTKEVHDRARTLAERLRRLEWSVEQAHHLERMVALAEEAAAGLLDERRAVAATEDLQAAETFCEQHPPTA